MLELTAPALFVAGLAGSPHCALMCAPLQALALQGTAPVPPARAILLLHGGRVFGYGMIGAAAGALGARSMAWLPEGTGDGWVQLVAASALLGAGLLQWQSPSVPCRPHARPAPGRARWRGPASLQLMLRGLGWALMPCALLYALLLLAALSGGRATGAALLVAYGLGTVPLLAISGRVFGRLTHAVGEPGRRWSASLMMLLALASAATVLGHHASGPGSWCRSLAG